MNYDDWFEYYNHPDSPTLKIAFGKAFADGAVHEEESFNDWCRAEYQCYLEDGEEYEVPYTGLWD